VPRSKRLHSVAGDLDWRRDLGDNPPIRPAEAKLAVRPSIDLVALLVHGAMMSPTQQGEIRQRSVADSPAPRMCL
jgi:hypothetical protein